MIRWLKKRFRLAPPMSEAEFHSEEYRPWLLALALVAFEKYPNDKGAVIKDLLAYPTLQFSEAQATLMADTAEVELRERANKVVLEELTQQAQQLVKMGQVETAYALAKTTFLQHPSAADIVSIFFQIGDRFKSETEVLTDLGELSNLVPEEHYNIHYRIGLYLKDKKRYAEAIAVFEKLNQEMVFEWNYYQIGIMHNLLGNTSACLHHLEKAFEMLPSLTQDAWTFPELQNLQDHPEFQRMAQPVA